MLQIMSFSPKITDPVISTDGGWLSGTDGGSMLTDGGRSPQITSIV